MLAREPASYTREYQIPNNPRCAPANAAPAPDAPADRRVAPGNRHRTAFWHEALALRGSITPIVARRVLVFGLASLAVTGGVLLGDSGFGWTGWSPSMVPGRTPPGRGAHRSTTLRGGEVTQVS